MSVWKRIAQSPATTTGTTTSATFAQSTPVDNTHTLVAVLQYSDSAVQPASTSWGVAPAYSIGTGAGNMLQVYVVRGDSQKNAFSATFAASLTQIAVVLYAFEGFVAAELNSPAAITAQITGTTATIALPSPGTVATKTIAIAAVALGSGGGGTWGSFSDGFETAPIAQSRLHTAVKAITAAGTMPTTTVSWTSSRAGRAAMFVVQGTEAPAAPANAAPTVAIPGGERTVAAGEPVQLTTSVSDSDGTVTGYAWTVVSADIPTGQITLAAPTTATVTLTAASPATVVLRCTVTDNGGASAEATVTVNVTKRNDAGIRKGTKVVKKRTRGSKEILRRYRGGRAIYDKSLVAEWNFTEAAAPYRATHGGLPLVLGNTTAVPRVTTPFGTGIQITSPAYLKLPKEVEGIANIGKTTQRVSMAAWVYRTDTNTGFVAGAWQEDNADPRRSYGLFIDLGTYGGGQKSCFHVSKSGGPTPGYPYSRDYSASGQTVPTGEWHFHVGTYDGAVARSYLDGAFVAIPSFTDNQGNTYSKNPYPFTEGLNATPCDFTVGAVQLSAGMGNQFEGTIAKLRVWDRALTAAEVAALYAAERPTA